MVEPEYTDNLNYQQGQVEAPLYKIPKIFSIFVGQYLNRVHM